jgi:hypothetical protein
MANTIYTDKHWRQAQADIASLRVEFPGANTARLYRQLVKSACIKAGATGAGTTAVGLIPGFGKLLGWAVNLAGDAALTASIQRDLMLHIFVLHGRTPGPKDDAQMLLWMGSIGVGAIELVEQIGGGVLKGMAKRVLGKVLRRGLPMAEVLASSATHVAGTYLLARKVDAYCKNSGDTTATIEVPDPRRIRQWTMLSLGTVVDDEQPKSVKDAFRH